MIESRLIQNISIEISPQVVRFQVIGFRLADPMRIPGNDDRILSDFIGFSQILPISRPESDHKID